MINSDNKPPFPHGESEGKGGMYPAGSASPGQFQGRVVGMENRLPLEGSRKSHPARGGLMSRQKCGIVGAPRPSVMWFGHSTKSGASEGCGAPPPALRRALQPRWKPLLKTEKPFLGSRGFAPGRGAGGGQPPARAHTSSSAAGLAALHLVGLRHSLARLSQICAETVVEIPFLSPFV